MGEKTTSIAIYCHPLQKMYAVEFISQTRKKQCKLDNYRINILQRHLAIKFLTARSRTVICKEFLIQDLQAYGIFQFSSTTEDLHVKRTCICCGSNSSLVYILSSFVLGYGYV